MKSEIKSRAIQRLKIIAGQVRGLQGMVEDEKYCIDIINQTEAIRRALSGVEDLILRNHLSTHLTHQMKHGEEEKALKEMMTVYNLVGRK
jgi:DNA-binding FrmR family transcriptional regulator